MRYKIGIVTVGAALLCGIVWAAFFFASPGTAREDEVPVAYTARLYIPSIGVDALIEDMGITPAGAMETPEGPDNVGWYSLGSRPGEVGTATIAGHRGWKNGSAAVFDHLDALRKGDVIQVMNSSGELDSFIVRETRVYGRDEYAPEVFVSSDGTHLNLITCVGDWDRSLKTSAERLVVFTDKISP